MHFQFASAGHSAEDTGLQVQDIVSESLVGPVPRGILRNYSSLILPAPGTHMFIDPFVYVMQMDT